MPLKPSDIQEKTFATALRGYDLGEVDDFLDEVIATIRDLEERISLLQANRPAFGVSDPAEDASAVGRALIAAQETADRIVAEAQAEADRLLDDARAESERTLSEARSQADTYEERREAIRAEAEASIRELQDRVAGLKGEIVALAAAASVQASEMDVLLDDALQMVSDEVDDVGEAGEGDGDDAPGAEAGETADSADSPDEDTGDESDDYEPDADGDSDDAEGDSDGEDMPDTADNMADEAAGEPDHDGYEATPEDSDEDDPAFEPWRPRMDHDED
jgi:cell division initiation protein